MRVIVVVCAVVALIAASGASLYIWDLIGEAEMGWRGWVALVLGVAFALLLGVGLMILVFISARRGYDDGPDRNTRR